MPRQATLARGGKARTDKQVYALARTSFVHAVRTTRASVRTAALWMRVAPSTVTAWLSGKTPVNALKVLRSRRLSKPFLVCLRIEDRRDA
jgi:hypothetical protein